MSTNLFSKIKSIFTAFLALLSTLGVLAVSSNTPLNKEELNLMFTVISDTHVTGKLCDGDRRNILRDGVRDMARAQVPADAVVIAGDLTESGTPEYYDNFYSVFEPFCSLENIIPALGNHDTWTEGYEQEFIAHQSEYVEGLDKVYYHVVVKGYYFIVLGSEQRMQNEAYFSPEQLAWFETILEQAVASEKPVFVVCHQPINTTNRISESWTAGVMGEQSDEVYAQLMKYEASADIFFISGHLHSGFDFSGITNEGGIYFVDLPPFGKEASRGSYKNTGAGYQVEVYEDEIVFRARNFADSKWLEDFDRTITLRSQ